MHRVNNSIKLLSSGRFRRDLLELRFEYQDGPYVTFAAIFTAECGLRPIYFFQLFGGEALVYAVVYVTG